MNNTYTRNIAILLVSSVLLFSCAGKPDPKAAVAKKKEELEKLKADRSKINDQIAQVTDEITKLSGGDDGLKAKEIVARQVSVQTFEHTVRTQGGIESLENIQLSAKTAGIVTQVYAVEGENVSAGQVLGQVDNSLTIRQIEELKSNLELAKTVFERQQNLWNQKIGTEVQYLQAKNNKESMERRLASLSEQNDMTRIKSPISGVVDEVQLRVGQNIAPGMPAVRIINNENLKVKANISESYVSMIKKGNKAIITIPDLNNKVINATVTFVGRNINPLSRTFAVEVKLPSSPDLRPNMTVEIKVIFESDPGALVVPINLVQDVNGEKVVYTVETDGTKSKAHKNIVKLGGVFDDFAKVTDGLKAGDQIITVGYQGLNNGDLVKI